MNIAIVMPDVLTAAVLEEAASLRGHRSAVFADMSALLETKLFEPS